MTARPPAADSGRRPDRATLVIAVLLFALAAVLAVDAATITAGVASYSRIGPEVFPYGIAAGLAVLAAATMVSAFTETAEEWEPIAAAPIFWIVGGLAAQIALLSFAGFSVATGAVFAATARAFGRRRLWLTYPIGVIFSLAVWLAFAAGLKLVLPAGPLERLALPYATRFVGFLVDYAAVIVDFVRDTLSAL